MGGGGSKSVSTVKSVNKTVLEAMATSIMSCKGSGVLTQSFVISGDYNVAKKVKQVQHFKLSASCSQDDQNVQNIQNSIISAIKNEAESKSVSLLGALGSSRAEQNTFIENEVKTKIGRETINEIVQNTNAAQEIVISGNNNIIDTFEQSQTMEIVMENSQKALSNLTSVTAISSQVEAKSAAVQSNFIADIFDSIFGGMTLIIIIIAIAGLSGLYIFSKVGGFGFLLNKKQKKYDYQLQSQQQYYQPQQLPAQQQQPLYYPPGVPARPAPPAPQYNRPPTIKELKQGYTTVQPQLYK